MITIQIGGRQITLLEGDVLVDRQGRRYRYFVNTEVPEWCFTRDEFASGSFSLEEMLRDNLEEPSSKKEIARIDFATNTLSTLGKPFP
jgi:hypothetical protein